MLVCNELEFYWCSLVSSDRFQLCPKSRVSVYSDWIVNSM